MDGAANTLDLVVRQGKSFSHALQWERENLVYKTITAATQANPCRLTAPTHGMPADWHFRIVNAKGMTQLNVDPDTGLGANGLAEYRNTLVDANTVELNDVAASNFKAYTASSGSIVYREPYDLSLYTARMTVRPDPESETKTLELTSAGGGIVLNNTLKTITIVISEAQAILLGVGTYYYDLEMVETSSGKVTELVHGSLVVPEREITR